MTETIEQFYRRTYQEHIKKVSNRVGGVYNAEDVVQEAFARALKYWDSFDPTHKTIGSWFNTILNNAAKDFSKEERMLGMCLEFDEEVYDGVAMSQTSHHMLRKLEKLINKKTGHTRELLYLYYLKGYKPREIQEVLGLNNMAIRIAVLRFKKEALSKMGG